MSGLKNMARTLTLPDPEGATPRSCRPATLAPALPVGARLAAAAADRHRTPGARAVLGVVVEGPATRLVAADLQPHPCPLRHRRVHDRQKAAKRGVHSARNRRELRAPVALKLHPQMGAVGDAVERGEGGSVDGCTVV